MVGSMTKQIRDIAQATGQMLSFREILDGDGPMKTIADRVVTGLGLARRSRYLSGLQLQSLLDLQVLMLVRRFYRHLMRCTLRLPKLWIWFME